MKALATRPPERVSSAQYEAEMATIVRLHLIKRKTPSEISAETGIPVHRIKDRLNRAGYKIARTPAVHHKPLGTVEDWSLPTAEHDDRLVAALVARGGYPRLSERPTRHGHVVCLPLVPFEGRP